MKNHDILQELYRLDPSLQRYEAQLLERMDEIKSIRPTASYDPDFYKQLYQKIKDYEASEKPSFNFFSTFNFMKTFSWVALLLVAVAVPGLYGVHYYQTHPSTNSSFVAVSDHGFGDLSILIEMNGLGGGGESSFPGVNYEFTYNGNMDFDLPETMEVIKPLVAQTDIDTFLRDKNLTDWYQYGAEYGVAQLRNPEAQFPCPFEAYESICSPAISESELVSADELVSIFNEFLDDHHFSHEFYGDLVNPNGLYVQTPQDDYLNVATLNFEFLIDGHSINGPLGQPIVFVASIDMVSGEVWETGVPIQNYEISQYETSSSEMILDNASVGGFMPFVSQTTETSRVSLGDPEIIYVQAVTENGLGVIYIPAYRFPVLGKPDTLDRDYVTVPLVAEMADALDQSY
ncbi:MAG: hypothetical protein WCW30_00815 [Candidatus Gracilibacteria bacterium]|jgi:hypothetical protein